MGLSATKRRYPLTKQGKRRKVSPFLSRRPPREADIILGWCDRESPTDAHKLAVVLRTGVYNSCRTIAA